MNKAKSLLEKENGQGKVLAIKADVTNEEEVKKLIDQVVNELGGIDYWINNAGVNQPDKPIWEVDSKTIDRLIDIDLKGTILCSKLVMPIMIKQGNGQIFNVEGLISHKTVLKLLFLNNLIISKPNPLALPVITTLFIHYFSFQFLYTILL